MFYSGLIATAFILYPSLNSILSLLHYRRPPKEHINAATSTSKISNYKQHLVLFNKCYITNFKNSKIYGYNNISHNFLMDKPCFFVPCWTNPLTFVKIWVTSINGQNDKGANIQVKKSLHYPKPEILRPWKSFPRGAISYHPWV